MGCYKVRKVLKFLVKVILQIIKGHRNELDNWNYQFQVNKSLVCQEWLNWYYKYTIIPGIFTYARHDKIIFILHGN